jgi:integrase
MNGCDAQSVYANAVQLHKRSKELQRPLTHDEILLLRVYAAVASRHKATAEPANVYALADAGMTPGETTQVTLGDFDDPDHPTHVIAAGHAKGLESRFLPLDDFGQRVLARRTRAAVADGSPRHATLTYRPRKNLPGTPAATASSQGVLDRILSTVGLKAADVTASSIGLWRVRTTLEEHGPAAAQELSGRSTAEQMLASINKDLTTEYTEEDEDEIHSLTAA